ncbi:MAG: ATPase domain-containing protein [Candidatus Thermoplasmatota archaeon]|nr:ATPase domain-containing protein [Candidatus Thermoplasmatota archaeon]
MHGESGDHVFGIEKLDNLTTGRMEPGLLGLIYGPPGTGKTTLGSHFLFRGASLNQNVCLLTYEPTSLFTRKFQRFKCYESSWLKDGYISIFMLQNLMENIGIDPERIEVDDLDLLFDVMVQIISDMDMKRVIIDPGAPFIDLLNKNGRGSYLTELKIDLVKLNASAFIVYDIDPLFVNKREPGYIPNPNLFDVMIKLNREDSGRSPVNTLHIQRWKDAPHSRSIYVIDMSSDSVIMAPRLFPSEGLE